ncbi:uncharacterized protein LOC132742914 [Ruditapes philippinarum]|uniref:uncharacterized protein LOC132742914 n=1 Tax=Ruditapes philippinarum TaxID=129788 RepID=UPI00295A5EB9|nr:uncharacterized protein LOC132742914 [Ruditapes philippinarum]
MDTFETALTLIRKDMFMCTSDIRHAYYSVPVAEESQVFLRFQWKGQIYQYTCIPNGYRDGPRLFTKLLKPVFAKLRAEGHICTGFIDDSLLCGESYNDCLQTVHVSYNLLEKLGFFLNEEKSDYIPSKKVIYLGFVIDSDLMLVTLPQEKQDHIKEICRSLKNSHKVTIREVARVIGVLVASFPAVDYGKLYYRAMEKQKIQALKSNYGNFEAEMIITLEMKHDLQWWIDNIDSQSRVIDRGNPSVEIQTDSSLSGWGVYYQGEKFGGRWTSEEKKFHINVLELIAILFALQALVEKLKNQHVKILSDSSTAVSYINNMGGIRSDSCNKVSRDIWEYCMSKNIWLTCAHIPGLQNEADLPSRQFKDNIEWALQTNIFEKICCIWQKPVVDLFCIKVK